MTAVQSGRTSDPARRRAAAFAELDDAVRPFFGSLAGRPRTVLFGNYGQGNIGDEAILDGILGVLRPHADVTVMSRAPHRVSELHAIPAEGLNSVGGIRALLRARVIAIGGGGIFGNDMTPLPKLLPALALVLSTVLRKRVVFLSIGAYRTTPAWVQYVLRSLARRSALVTVRDEESRAVLSPGRAVLVPDPGMFLRPADAAAVDQLLKGLAAPPGPLLGISLKPAVDPAVDERQCAVAKQAAEQWLVAHPTGGVALLCFSERGNSGIGFARTDRTMSEEVRSGLPGQERVVIVDADVHPTLMKGVVGRCRAVVAHRLHAQMFAADSEVPFVGLTWERKSDVFLASIGATVVDLRQAELPDLRAWLAETG